jgi:ribosomal protein S18 acetylase RimI-like enzyme
MKAVLGSGRGGSAAAGKGVIVVEYRRFRNTDPPRLLEVWNDALRGRGAVALRTSTPFERHAFAKPFFDPDGLIVAADGPHVVGFAHAGFGPTADETALDPAHGVVCVVAVRQANRRRGIGTELLRRAEDYLRQRGTRHFHAGQVPPLAPFYLGMYGGSELPGVLESDPTAAPFLLRHGYQPDRTVVVLQRKVNQVIKTVDTRFVALRQRFEVCDDPEAPVGSWWRECYYGLVEPVLFALRDRTSGAVAASAFVWEMEGFSCRWERPAAGVLDLRVAPELQRQGLAKFLMVQIVKRLQDQCFDLVELHVPDDNAAGLQLCRGLGFERVDVGRSFRRPEER